MADGPSHNDDGPSITVASSASTAATAIHLGNAAGQHTTGGLFGYDLGADGHLLYPGNVSDFVDAAPGTAGVQLALSGTVGTGAILTSDVHRTAESATSASFDFSF